MGDVSGTRDVGNVIQEGAQADGDQPAFAQRYVTGDNDEASRRNAVYTNTLNPVILQSLQNMMHRANHYYRCFLTAKERMLEVETLELHIKIIDPKQKDSRRYNEPTAYGIALRDWTMRKKGFANGRVYFARPQAGEPYYLRLLLYYIPCPTSFECLRTVEGTLKPTYRTAGVSLNPS